MIHTLFVLLIIIIVVAVVVWVLRALFGGYRRF